MTKQKAKRLLESARESLTFWRECYVDLCRDKTPTLDIHLNYYGGTIRNIKKAEYLENIASVKERIAKYERVAL